jgi:hypothetical protein
MQSSNGSGGGAGNFAGSQVEGAFSDDFFWDVSPLVDLAGFGATPSGTVAAATLTEGAVTTLGIRVNGRLRTAASIILRRASASLAKPTVDYTVGATTNRTGTITTMYTSTQTISFGSGTITVNSGDIKLDLPAGDYDPNIVNGTIAGFINIPVTLVNDLVVEASDLLRYSLGNSATAAGTDTTDVTGGGDARPDTGLAVSKGNQGTLCSQAVKSVQLTILDNDKPTFNQGIWHGLYFRWRHYNTHVHNYQCRRHLTDQHRPYTNLTHYIYR